jgi:hypothetical protein
MKKTIQYFIVLLLIIGFAAITGCSDKDKLAERERIINIGKALAYLNAEKFDIDLRFRSISSSMLKPEIDEGYSYSDFKYNPEEKSLEFKSSVYNALRMNSDLKGDGWGYMKECKIILPSANGVILISDYSKSQYEVETKSKVITIKANHIEKKWENRLNVKRIIVNQAVLGFYDDANKYSLKTKPWVESKEKEIKFIVKDDAGEKFKSALEDLLEAHEVIVAKY